MLKQNEKQTKFISDWNAIEFILVGVWKTRYLATAIYVLCGFVVQAMI